MDFEEFDTINIDIEDVFKTAMIGALDSLQTAYLGKLGVNITPDVREKINHLSTRQVHKLFD